MTPEEARTGFGIPFLMEDVREFVAQGRTLEESIELVAERCELRSEALEVLRIALNGKGTHNEN